jgi:tetratricopeptide (TPR) repeat protein
MKTIAGVVLAVALTLGTVAWAQTKQDDLLSSVDGKLLKKLRAETRRDDAQLYEKLGFSYFQQQEFDRAFLYFNAAVQKSPGLYWSWYYLGLLNLESGETYFKKAIEANSGFAPAYYWLGRVAAKQGKTAEAIKVFKDYIRMAERNPEEAERLELAKRLLAELTALAESAGR